MSVPLLAYLVVLLFQDLNLSMERLTSNKAFTNKLWNAGKFVLQNLPSQNDASVWENILSYKVCFSSMFRCLSLYQNFYFSFDGDHTEGWHMYPWWSVCLIVIYLKSNQMQMVKILLPSISKSVSVNVLLCSCIS